MNIRLFIITALLCLATSGKAEGFYSLSIGGVNVLDTYLSPEKYSGVEYRLNAESIRDSKKRALTYLMTNEIAFAHTKNRAGNATTLTGHYNFTYGVLYRWHCLDNKLTLRAGGMTEANIGFTYNQRNTSNNPAQGYASVSIGPEVTAHYRFTLWNKNMRVGYTMRMPWLGAMFSPNYGQSYYEIFNRGNYDHNVVFTSLQTFQMRQQLTLDVPVSKKVEIRVGYVSDIRQATPNNLKQHQWYNGGMIGIRW
ncbi:MAG: DUF3316 domain-containing protein [Prevotella sp.]|nr:DUF3316 domain-containing protein [Candidatus Prevotella equi]